MDSRALDKKDIFLCQFVAREELDLSTKQLTLAVFSDLPRPEEFKMNIPFGRRKKINDNGDEYQYQVFDKALSGTSGEQISAAVFVVGAGPRDVNRKNGIDLSLQHVEANLGKYANLSDEQKILVIFLRDNEKLTQEQQQKIQKLGFSVDLIYEMTMTDFKPDTNECVKALVDRNTTQIDSISSKLNSLIPAYTNSTNEKSEIAKKRAATEAEKEKVKDSERAAKEDTARARKLQEEQNARVLAAAEDEVRKQISATKPINTLLDTFPNIENLKNEYPRVYRFMASLNDSDFTGLNFDRLFKNEDGSFRDVNDPEYKDDMNDFLEFVQTDNLPIKKMMKDLRLNYNQMVKFKDSILQWVRVYDHCPKLIEWAFLLESRPEFSSMRKKTFDSKVDMNGVMALIGLGPSGMRETPFTPFIMKYLNKILDSTDTFPLVTYNVLAGLAELYLNDKPALQKILISTLEDKALTVEECAELRRNPAVTKNPDLEKLLNRLQPNFQLTDTLAHQKSTINYEEVAASQFEAMSKMNKETLAEFIRNMPDDFKLKIMKAAENKDNHAAYALYALICDDVKVLDADRLKAAIDNLPPPDEKNKQINLNETLSIIHQYLDKVHGKNNSNANEEFHYAVNAAAKQSIIILPGAKLSDLQLEGDMSYANFKGAELNNFFVRNADLSHAVFDQVRLEGESSFYRATLDDASFQYAVLPGVKFNQMTVERANFEGANLAGAQCVDYVKFTGCNLDGANCNGIKGSDRLTVDNPYLGTGQAGDRLPFLPVGEIQEDQLIKCLNALQSSKNDRKRAVLDNILENFNGAYNRDDVVKLLEIMKNHPAFNYQPALAAKSDKIVEYTQQMNGMKKDIVDRIKDEKKYIKEYSAEERKQARQEKARELKEKVQSVFKRGGGHHTM